MATDLLVDTTHAVAACVASLFCAQEAA